MKLIGNREENIWSKKGLKHRSAIFLNLQNAETCFKVTPQSLPKGTLGEVLARLS